MAHKILLISDIHFGCKSNNEQTLEMMQAFFCKTVYNAIVSKKITDCRILGDVFDCRNTLNVKTINTVLDIFTWYETNLPDVKWKILLGNHCIYYRNRLDVNSLNLLKRHKNVEIIEDITIETINNKKIISFPWIIDASDIDNRFTAYCDGTEKFDLCLGHFEIQGFEITKGQVDTYGRELSQFKNFNRTFSGHYHLRNTMGTVSYLGCPYQLTWSDYGDLKGIHIYDVDSNTTEFIENINSPRFIKITLDDVENKTPILKNIAGNYIKLEINKKVKESYLTKLHSKLESLSPMKYEVENIFEQDITPSDDSLTSITDPLKLLFEYTNNIDLNTGEELIEKKELERYLLEIYGASV